MNQDDKPKRECHAHTLGDEHEGVTILPEVVFLTDAQRMDLDRRLEEHRQDPDSGTTWEELKARLQGK